MRGKLALVQNIVEDFLFACVRYTERHGSAALPINVLVRIQPVKFIMQRQVMTLATRARCQDGRLGLEKAFRRCHRTARSTNNRWRLDLARAFNASAHQSIKIERSSVERTNIPTLTP